MSTPDHNYRSIADVNGYELHDERIDPALDGLNPRDFDDVLKFSRARYLYARRLYVVGGRENAVDMNRRCEHVTLEDSCIEGGQQAAVVIKGGSTAITLRNIALVNITARWCDVLIGDWSDQSWEKTTGVHLMHVSRRDGKPVRVVVGRADWPTITGGNVQILRWHSYALKLYWWSKYLWTRLLLRKFTAPMHV